MNSENIFSLEVHQKMFEAFAQKENLSGKQTEQFRAYLIALLDWNKKFNITAITSVQEVLSFHFQDSLAIKDCLNFGEISMVADVGTGGGFPGIPLKILFPHLKLKLIEVNQKKVQFLKTISEMLGLSDVEVIEFDWRTFLRKTSYPIDLFVSRASLSPEELIRIFKPDCPYLNARMVYWASQQWHPTSKEAPLIEREHSYKIDHKSRRLIFFKKTDV